MKKIVLAVLAFVVFFSINISISSLTGIRSYALPAEEFPVYSRDNDVVAVLAARNKQAHPTFTTNKDSLDTVWILFANGDYS